MAAKGNIPETGTAEGPRPDRVTSGAYASERTVREADSSGRVLVEGDARSPAADGWSPHPRLHVVAMDYETGDRAVFGPGHHRADLCAAVTASCAVPSWFPPVEIDGDQYVDGGVLSATHADLAAGLELDDVYVLAPLVARAETKPLAKKLFDAHQARLHPIARQVISGMLAK